MAVGLYMDVHVPQAITNQLRRRGVDVLSAIEDGSAGLTDEELLERVLGLGRLLFTQDIRFKALAENGSARTDLLQDSYSDINSAVQLDSM